MSASGHFHRLPEPPAGKAAQRLSWPRGRAAEHQPETLQQGFAWVLSLKFPSALLTPVLRSSQHACLRSGQVWAESYADRLSIREYSQHSKCATCCRHKLILSRLGNDRKAHEEQTIAYGAHLRRQYEDRCQYWKARATSRSKVLSGQQFTTICLIIDSIDHSKLRWPRCLPLQSKDFGSFVRPHLTCAGVLVHGYMSMLAISESFIPGDSSRTTEILAHVLHRLASEFNIDCRFVQLLIQSDNCSKEGKNNTVLRWLSAQVAARRLARAETRFLQSGHSHEDVDSWFALLAGFIEQHQDVPTPEAFHSVLEKFLQQDGKRSTEPVGHVVKLDAVRNWPLGFRVSSCFNH